uniref:Calcitonin/calcitonin-related polypeptide, alpha n=1 Tax=Mus musculus TaxID=10090 RepID=A0A0U1RNG0_MOUSE
MGFLKFSPFLVVSILLLYQACSLQAVPLRSILESSPGMATLSEEEVRLLAALVQDYMQMKARELEQEEEQEAEGSR